MNKSSINKSKMCAKSWSSHSGRLRSLAILVACLSFAANLIDLTESVPHEPNFHLINSRRDRDIDLDEDNQPGRLQEAESNIVHKFQFAFHNGPEPSLLETHYNSRPSIYSHYEAVPFESTRHSSLTEVAKPSSTETRFQVGKLIEENAKFKKSVNTGDGVQSITRRNANRLNGLRNSFNHQVNINPNEGYFKINGNHTVQNIVIPLPAHRLNDRSMATGVIVISQDNSFPPFDSNGDTKRKNDEIKFDHGRHYHYELLSSIKEEEIEEPATEMEDEISVSNDSKQPCKDKEKEETDFMSATSTETDGNNASTTTISSKLTERKAKEVDDFSEETSSTEKDKTPQYSSTLHAHIHLSKPNSDSVNITLVKTTTATTDSNDLTTTESMPTSLTSSEKIEEISTNGKKFTNVSDGAASLVERDTTLSGINRQNKVRRRKANDEQDKNVTNSSGGIIEDYIHKTNNKVNRSKKRNRNSNRNRFNKSSTENQVLNVTTENDSRSVLNSLVQELNVAIKERMKELENFSNKTNATISKLEMTTTMLPTTVAPAQHINETNIEPANFDIKQNIAVSTTTQEIKTTDSTTTTERSMFIITTESPQDEDISAMTSTEEDSQENVSTTPSDLSSESEEEMSAEEMNITTTVPSLHSRQIVTTSALPTTTAAPTTTVVPITTTTTSTTTLAPTTTIKISSKKDSSNSDKSSKVSQKITRRRVKPIKKKTSAVISNKITDQTASSGGKQTKQSRAARLNQLPSSQSNSNKKQSESSTSITKTLTTTTSTTTVRPTKKSTIKPMKFEPESNKKKWQSAEPIWNVWMPKKQSTDQSKNNEKEIKAVETESRKAKKPTTTSGHKNEIWFDRRTPGPPKIPNNFGFAQTVQIIKEDPIVKDIENQKHKQKNRITFTTDDYNDDDGDDGESDDDDDMGESNVPGLPGVDYPILSTIPATNFDCSKQQYPGFYSDMDVGCQVYHSCSIGGTFRSAASSMSEQPLVTLEANLIRKVQPQVVRKQAAAGRHSFLCPNGTIFSQEYLICDWWYNVKCEESPKFYPLNRDVFSGGLPKPTLGTTAATLLSSPSTSSTLITTKLTNAQPVGSQSEHSFTFTHRPQSNQNSMRNNKDGVDHFNVDQSESARTQEKNTFHRYF